MKTKPKKSKKKLLWLALLGVILFVALAGLKMKKSISSSALSAEGPFSVCIDETDVSNTSLATLYYPCSILDPIPATTLMSGYGASHRVLNWLAGQMAANGFIVLGMTPVDRYGMDSDWRDAHLSGIAKLKRLNSQTNVLQGKIAIDKLQVCGHSKGGGGALWAADMLGSELKSTVVMCPFHEEFTNLGGVRTPTLIQSGASDIYATHEMTFGEYNMLPTDISKAYFEYTSAKHFSWGVLGLGAKRLHPVFGADIVAWMKYYLEGDMSQDVNLAKTTGKSTHLWEDRTKQTAAVVSDAPAYDN